LWNKEHSRDEPPQRASVLTIDNRLVQAPMSTATSSAFGF